MIRTLLIASIYSLAAGACAFAEDSSAQKDQPSTVFDAFAHIEAGYGFGQFSGGGTDIDFNDGSINGRASLADTISGPLGYQLDGLFGYTGTDSERDIFDIKGGFISPAGHIFYRAPGVGAFGALVQYSFTRMDTEVKSDGAFINSNDLYAGPEAQYYLGNSTLSGKLAYHYRSLSSETEVHGDGITASVGFKYFINDNFDIAINGTFESMGIDSDGDNLNSNTMVAALKADYKFAESPFTVSANISYGHIASKYDDTSTPISTKDNEVRAMVGLTYSLTDVSLKTRDRSGASFEPVDPNPNGLMFPLF
jgi:hypothetical protein